MSCTTYFLCIENFKLCHSGQTLKFTLKTVTICQSLKKESFNCYDSNAIWNGYNSHYMPEF